MNQSTLSPTPPVYSYAVLHFAGTNILSIKDEFDESKPSITVTNTAEYVLKDIRADIGTLPTLIVYQDTQGHWDRLVVDEQGRFRGIRPIVPGMEAPITDEDSAIQLIVTNTAIPHQHGLT